MPRTARRREAARHTISRQLKDVIESRGLSPYAIGKLADVDPGMVSRFVSGERDLRLESVDRIAQALGLRLVEVGRAKGKKPTTKKEGSIMEAVAAIRAAGGSDWDKIPDPEAFLRGEDEASVRRLKEKARTDDGADDEANGVSQGDTFQ